MRVISNEYPSMTRRVSPLCSCREVLVATTKRSPFRPLEMNVLAPLTTATDENVSDAVKLEVGSRPFKRSIYFSDDLRVRH
jgi:hypothetical protein